MDAKVEFDLCCVCFGSYHEDIDTGREQLQYSCNRWIHKDCVVELGQYHVSPYRYIDLYLLQYIDILRRQSPPNDKEM